MKSGLNLGNGVLHSTLHSNPTVGVECYLDCYHPQSKKWIGLTSGLHSKNNCGFGLWIALQKCRSVKCPGRGVQTMSRWDHFLRLSTARDPSDFISSMLPHFADDVPTPATALGLSLVSVVGQSMPNNAAILAIERFLARGD